MREYVDQTWGWREEDQRAAFDASFEAGGCLIISAEDEPVGSLSTERMPDRLRLLRIEIAPLYQSRGIGSAFVRDLIAEAQDSGQFVQLRVLRVNPARRLYERLGFAVVASTETHFIMEHPGGRAA